ncbi:MAG: thiamine phosphate synthase [Proteobacteria bacterium]|nr:thiamine phosphate synthase [Pseudomonadota bacterium]
MTAEQTHEQALKGLYAITDENLIAEDAFEQTIESALQGGARIIQYRDKSGNEEKRLQQASALRSLCDRYNAVLIINDDIALALRVKADGVHLGKNDDSISQARQILGDKTIIGISCYNDINLAITAENNSADYVAFGAMFSSSTKPDAKNADLDIISEAKQKLNIPVCTIGGITEKNIKQLIDHGTDMAAIINHLFSADDIKLTATRLNQSFK